MDNILLAVEENKEEQKQKRRGRPPGSKKKETVKPVRSKNFSIQETINISKMTKTGSRIIHNSETEESISVHLFQTEPAIVSVNKKLTKNLENYESATIGVVLTRPCYVEEMNDTLQCLLGEVDDVVTKELISLIQLKRNMEI